MKRTLREQIAERIAIILQERGMRQQDLADATGMSKSYISQIMHGTVNLTLESIELLESVLKTPIIQVCGIN